jgi:hypothetical protein
MQAFLWRHLVPAKNLQAMVLNPSYQPPKTRTRPPKLQLAELPSEPPKFSARQVAGRLRQLDLLFDEWLLTDDFYNLKIAECDIVQPPKPAAKPAAKIVAKTSRKKPAAKVAANPKAKTPGKPAAKGAITPAAKPAAKPAGKPAGKKPARTAAKLTAKTPAKEAPKPAAKPKAE